MSSAPAHSGGANERTKRRPGPENSESPAPRALRAMVEAAMTSASAASSIQVPSQASGFRCPAATHAAASAVTPIATVPHPGTAVKEPACSMARRM